MMRPASASSPGCGRPMRTARTEGGASGSLTLSSLSVPRRTMAEAVPTRPCRSSIFSSTAAAPSPDSRHVLLPAENVTAPVPWSAFSSASTCAPPSSPRLPWRASATVPAGLPAMLSLRLDGGFAPSPMSAICTSPVTDARAPARRVNSTDTPGPASSSRW